MSAVRDRDWVRERRDQAIELREDGDFSESAAAFAALIAEAGADAETALEYARTLRKLDRFADADAVLEAAMALAPADLQLRQEWAAMPRHEVNFEATIARGRFLRALFPPGQHPAAWESFWVELDCFYEMGEWHRLEQAVREQWANFLENPELLAHGIAALNKLFLIDDAASMAAAAAPEAWAQLPDGAKAHILARVDIARHNLAAIEQTGVRVISVGQNCLPYQLAGRWGLVARKADPAVLTPFDLGGFINDSAASAIATDFAAFARREDYKVTKAWGGGKMFLHSPTGVGFFHERGSHWVTPDGGRFFAKIAMMAANWQMVKTAPRRLFVYCACGAGDLAKMLAAAGRLTGPDGHVLIIDVRQQRHDCPDLPNVTYRHIPYPRDYDWSNIYHQCSAAGLRFERAVAEAIGWGIVRLAPDARALLAHLRAPEAEPGAALTSAELVARSWQLSARNGLVIGERFGFGETGLIEDYVNENESAWRLDHGVLKIFKRNGDLMWTAAALDQLAGGVLQIRLATPLNPELDFYLTETGPKTALPAAVPPRRYSGRLRVLLLSNGLDIEARLAPILAGADIVRIGHVAQIDDHPDRNLFISGLELSHAAQPEAAAAFIERMTRRFALSIFYELSGHNTGYLNSFGLRSFHRDFGENAGVDALGLDFVAAAAAAGVYKVEHYADKPAYDSFKDWVVSASHQPATMPNIASRGDYRVFEQPVFEFSVYVCHRFDALDVALQDALTLVEMRMLRFRGESSGFRLAHARQPGELGRLLYTTSRDAPARLRERPISMPVLIEDDGPVRLPEHDDIRARWRSEFKVEIAEIAVHEFENCVVAGTGTIFCEETFVRGTDYLLMFLNSSSLDPIMRGLQHRHVAQHVDGVAIVGFNALYDNYYHFVAEAGAAISLCMDLLKKRDLPRITLLTGKLNRFRRDYLDMLLQGDPRYHVVELDRTSFITADTVIYCDNVGRTVHQQVCLEEVAFAEKIIARLGLQSCAAGRRLYVARTDTAGRSMRNEAAVIARLEAMGFEIFIGSRHSVAEQVKAFREARMIVAPHGAGLTNLLFCQPGTVVVEWQQSGYFNTGMMRLAQLNNLRYYSQMFFPEAAEHFRDEWEIDIDRAMALIAQLGDGGAG